MRMLTPMAILVSVVLAMPAAAAPFLTFHRVELLPRRSVEVQVGLRQRENREPGERAAAADLWFSAAFATDGISDGPPKWTDGAQCPAASMKLREVEHLIMPRLRIPLKGGEPGGDMVVDGVDYAIEVDGGVLDGQAAGPIRFSSNVGTGLATWVEGMLAALAPCWSTRVPGGIS